MQLDRKTIIDTIIEADELTLSPVNKNELYKEYAEKDDHNLIIELISTLKLANRQIRFLERQNTENKLFN
jgi:hypothetical protein